MSTHLDVYPHYAIDNMNDFETLLDTPKKNRLQADLGDLRTHLKNFERTFTEANGRKPKQVDIKSDRTVAASYKRYHRLQDALAGKITYEELFEEPKQIRAGKRENVQSQHRNSSRRQTEIASTPRKSRKDDEPTVPSSVSPKVILTEAIGPTPHRDGKVLGLFDILQRSGSATMTASPSSSARKRKLEELYSDTPVRRSPLKSIQPQGQRHGKKEGDLLEFLTGTPQKIRTGYSNSKHSRTPRSDGRKFALSQLFATPSTQRFLCPAETDAADNTPLRSLVLGATPRKEPDTTGLDATPAYLKRSTSFKDRLLSAASSPVSIQNPKPASTFRPIGPPTLRHFRSFTSNILVQEELPHLIQNSQDGAEEDQDDWAAMRDLEQGTVGDDVLVKDSQLDATLNTNLQTEGEAQSADVPKYKKKGQKRTTKKSNIRPVTQKTVDEPQFVAADEDEDDSETGNNQVNTKIGIHLSEHVIKQSSVPGAADSQGINGTKSKNGGEKGQSTGTTKRKAHGTINPNAQSHMNFRSLKIKNKNSKANGKGFGRGRFAKSRR